VRKKGSTLLTPAEPGIWELRPDWSPDSRRILFVRAPMGEVPALWAMDRDGSHLRRLTDAQGRGADFPRWVR